MSNHINNDVDKLTRYLRDLNRNTSLETRRITELSQNILDEANSNVPVEDLKLTNKQIIELKEQRDIYAQKTDKLIELL